MDQHTMNLLAHGVGRCTIFLDQKEADGGTQACLAQGQPAAQHLALGCSAPGRAPPQRVVIADSNLSRAEGLRCGRECQAWSRVATIAGATETKSAREGSRLIYCAHGRTVGLNQARDRMVKKYR